MYFPLIPIPFLNPPDSSLRLCVRLRLACRRRGLPAEGMADCVRYILSFSPEILLCLSIKSLYEAKIRNTETGYVFPLFPFQIPPTSLPVLYQSVSLSCGIMSILSNMSKLSKLFLKGTSGFPVWGRCGTQSHLQQKTTPIELNGIENPTQS